MAGNGIGVSDSAATAHSPHGRRARHGVRIGRPGSPRDHGHGGHVAGTAVVARGKGRRIFYCLFGLFFYAGRAPWIAALHMTHSARSAAHMEALKAPAPLFGPASPSINSSRSTESERRTGRCVQAR